MSQRDLPPIDYLRSGGFEPRLRSVEIELSQVELKQATYDDILKEFRSFIKEVRPAMAAIVRMEATQNHMRDSLSSLAATVGTHGNRISTLENQMSVMQYVRAAVFAAVFGIVVAAGGMTWKAVTTHVMAAEPRGQREPQKD
jgi:hypothetical protein